MTNLPSGFLELERVTITCPVGVRFLDTATNTIVADGLLVEAYPVEDPTRRVSAVPNRSGVWAFHGLPGLRRFEYSVDDQRWMPEPPKRQFVAEVIDSQSRFLPAQVAVEVPVHASSMRDEFGSPLVAGLRTVPLFSSPGRPVPGGLAVARAQLLEDGGGTPAAWTLVEVSTSVLNRTVTAQGVTDGEGRLALIFPYPEPGNVSIGSPVGTGPQLLSQQSWTLTFRAWHAFHTQAAGFLDVDRVLGLTARTPDQLWDYGSPFIPFTEADLIFGRELVVPVRLPGDPRPRNLFITPAGSPP
jgi:hypothetical protein